MRTPRVRYSVDARGRRRGIGGVESSRVARLCAKARMYGYRVNPVRIPSALMDRVMTRRMMREAVLREERRVQEKLMEQEVRRLEMLMMEEEPLDEIGEMEVIVVEHDDDDDKNPKKVEEKGKESTENMVEEEGEEEEEKEEEEGEMKEATETMVEEEGREEEEEEEEEEKKESGAIGEAVAGIVTVGREEKVDEEAAGGVSEKQEESGVTEWDDTEWAWICEEKQKWWETVCCPYWETMWFDSLPQVDDELHWEDDIWNLMDIKEVPKL